MPLQAHVTNLDASLFVGRLAICRVHNGIIRKGKTIAWCKADGTITNARVTELYITENLDRVDADEAGPGEIIAVAGLPEVTIGETLADPEDPRPLPVITVDEPSISVTIGINHSPLAGQDGDKLTARQIKDRLDQELIGNVSIRVLDTERPDTWEVQGRGELQLAILVEMMRREGYEMTVGKPQVVIREIDGKRHEPVERLTIDVPEDYVGVITQMLALRKGRMEQMINHGTGWVRMDYLVPARGLIGFRTEFLTETRGTGLMHHVFDRWEPWAGDMRLRQNGSLVADRKGKTASFALFNLQERGTMFVEPGEDVYEGMIVGENARQEDLDVNAVKEKHLTNVRSSTSDVLVRLVPARKLSLDQALEWVREDECVEVTPHSVRLRKVALEQVARVKAAQLERLTRPDLDSALHSRGTDAQRPPEVRGVARSCTRRHGGDGCGRRRRVRERSARRSCWAAIRSVSRSASCPAGLDVTRSPMGEYELVVLRARRPAGAARGARQHHRRDLPQGPGGPLPAGQPGLRAPARQARRAADRPATTATCCRPRSPTGCGSTTCA